MSTSRALTYSTPICAASSSICHRNDTLYPRPLWHALSTKKGSGLGMIQLSSLNYRGPMRGMQVVRRTEPRRKCTHTIGQLRRATSQKVESARCNGHCTTVQRTRVSLSTPSDCNTVALGPAIFPAWNTRTIPNFSNLLAGMFTDLQQFVDRRKAFLPRGRIHLDLVGIRPLTDSRSRWGRLL